MVAVVQTFDVTLLSGNGTSITGSEPTGTVNGDLLYAILSIDGAVIFTANTPGDWTQVLGDANDNGVSSKVFRHQRGASPPDLQFNWSGNQQGCLAILRIDGHNVSAPIDDEFRAVGSSVSPISPSITTSIGPTGAATWTNAFSTGDGWHGHSVAIAPASGGDLLIIRSFCGDRDRITTDSGFPAGMDNDHFVRESGGANGACIGVADETQVGVGEEFVRGFSSSISHAVVHDREQTLTRPIVESISHTVVHDRELVLVRSIVESISHTTVVDRIFNTARVIASNISHVAFIIGILPTSFPLLPFKKPENTLLRR